MLNSFQDETEKYLKENRNQIRFLIWVATYWFSILFGKIHFMGIFKWLNEEIDLIETNTEIKPQIIVLEHAKDE